jgi:hypothetical protein
VGALTEAGISPDSYYYLGESLVHMVVSKQGDAKALRIMMNYGCSVQVADVHGLTPLHNCCGAAEPAFDVAECILETDIRGFQMADCYGACPLSYVKKEHWPLWIEFLEKRMNTSWPQRVSNEADATGPYAVAAAGVFDSFADRNVGTLPESTMESLLDKLVDDGSPSGATGAPASSWGNMFQEKEGSWKCGNCMVRNTGVVTRCVACETNRPDHTATSSENAIEIEAKLEP